jgi:hypothetical protein
MFSITATEQAIYCYLQLLGISTKHILGDIAAVKLALWKSGVSATNNVYKVLCKLVDLGLVVRDGTVFRLPHIKSTWTQHCQLLTETLAELIKLPYEIDIHREKPLPIGLRPDALVLLKNKGLGRCLVVEVCNTETSQYLQTKLTAWESWENSTEFLSELFGYRIPHYEFLIIGIDHSKSLKMEDL